MQAMLETRGQRVAQDTAPDPEGGPDARRLKTHVAPDRRRAIEDAARRHGRKSSAKPFNGFKEHVALDLDSNVTREVVVCAANHPEPEAVEGLAAAVEKGAGLCQLAIDLGGYGQPTDGPMGRAGRAYHGAPLAASGPALPQGGLPRGRCVQACPLSA